MDKAYFVTFSHYEAERVVHVFTGADADQKANAFVAKMTDSKKLLLEIAQQIKQWSKTYELSHPCPVPPHHGEVDHYTYWTNYRKYWDEAHLARDLHIRSTYSKEMQETNLNEDELDMFSDGNWSVDIVPLN